MGDLLRCPEIPEAYRSKSRDGLRRGVGSTPTFIIGNKLYRGMSSYDEMKGIVDSVAKTTTSPLANVPSTPAPQKPK